MAIVLLVTSFPLSGLLSQHHQISAAAAQLNQLQRANRALAEQNRLLGSKGAVEHLARERYQLVSPGQTLYDVLPPGGRSARTPATRSNGDPGSQPLVPPADAPDLVLDPNLAQGSAAAGGASPKATGESSASAQPAPRPAPTSFWSRVVDSLEFWR